MNTLHKCMLFLGGIGMAMLLGKPAGAQTQNKPSMAKKEKREVHINIVDDKDGKVKMIDTTFEVGPDFDMNAWMKANNIDVPEDDAKDVGDVLIMKHGCNGETQDFVQVPLNGGSQIIIKDFKDGMIPPCDTKDADCMKRWLESDSMGQVIKMIDPMKLPNGQDVIIYHDKDGKGNETKMIFNRIMVKKIMITDDGKEKEAKSLKMDIFPNPSSGIFNIDVAVPAKTTAQLEITDKAGTVLYEEEVKASGRIEVNLTAQGKGTYFVNLKQGKKSIQKQVMVN